MRNWLKQERAERGERPGGLSQDEREELKRLRDENARLRMEREILSKAAVFFAKESEVIGEVFSFIAAEKTNYPVAVMCRVFGVNRISFHDWERRPPSDRALTDAWLTEKIKQIHAASRGVYGAPRIHAELRLEHGIRVGRKRVARLMKAAGISGVRPRKRWKTTIRVPGHRARQRPRRTPISAPRRRTWCGSPTSPTCGAVRAGCTSPRYRTPIRGQIVGWSMATRMRSTLVVNALKMALGGRRPEPGLIHHSDQG